MGVYRWVGDVTLFPFPDGRDLPPCFRYVHRPPTDLGRSVVLRIRAATGGFLAAASDAEFNDLWWQGYYARKPVNRSEDPASVVVTRPDGTSYKFGISMVIAS